MDRRTRKLLTMQVLNPNVARLRKSRKEGGCGLKSIKGCVLWERKELMIISEIQKIGF